MARTSTPVCLPGHLPPESSPKGQASSNSGTQLQGREGSALCVVCLCVCLFVSLLVCYNVSMEIEERKMRGPVALEIAALVP